MTVVGHQFITLTVDICIQRGGREGLSAAAETCYTYTSKRLSHKHTRNFRGIRGLRTPTFWSGGRTPTLYYTSSLVPHFSDHSYATGHKSEHRGNNQHADKCSYITTKVSGHSVVSGRVELHLSTKNDNTSSGTVAANIAFICI